MMPPLQPVQLAYIDYSQDPEYQQLQGSYDAWVNSQGQEEHGLWHKVTQWMNLRHRFPDKVPFDPTMHKASTLIRQKQGFSPDKKDPNKPMKGYNPFLDTPDGYDNPDRPTEAQTAAEAEALRKKFIEAGLGGGGSTNTVPQGANPTVARPYAPVQTAQTVRNIVNTVAPPQPVMNYNGNQNYNQQFATISNKLFKQ